MSIIVSNVFYALFSRSILGFRTGILNSFAFENFVVTAFSIPRSLVIKCNSFFEKKNACYMVLTIEDKQMINE